MSNYSKWVSKYSKKYEIKNSILQETIEAINQSDLKVTIYQNDYCIWIRYKDSGYYEEQSFYFKKNPDKFIEDIIINKSIIKAKEATLKYIYQLVKQKVI